MTSTNEIDEMSCHCDKAWKVQQVGNGPPKNFIGWATMDLAQEKNWLTQDKTKQQINLANT